MRDDFVALILSHGRPDRMLTVRALDASGYTGAWYIVVDDDDETVDEYRREFGADRVIVFSKDQVAQTMDEGDNFADRRCIVYARNAAFDIARELGFKYFIQLDDDYKEFRFKFNENLEYEQLTIRNLDVVWEAMIELLQTNDAIASVAMAQGGDYIGGERSQLAGRAWLKRKAMNSFICDVDRQFEFLGRLNEDVSAYTASQRAGRVFMTVVQVYLNQLQTQSNAGGMSDIYLENGTYVKSFYSVMHCPSGVQVYPLQDRLQPRLHHRVSYNNVAPKIVADSHRKM